MLDTHSKTIRKSLLVGYGVPLAIVAIMGIGNEIFISIFFYQTIFFINSVELSVADPCQPIKPKFGME